LKVSDTLGQRRIAESRRPFDAAATQIGDWEGAAMDQFVTGEAPEAAPIRLLAEVLRQRAAISAVLRAIANSPHDLQPIFDTIIDNAVRLADQSPTIPCWMCRWRMWSECGTINDGRPDELDLAERTA
jgi:hypothetical protein